MLPKVWRARNAALATAAKIRKVAMDCIVSYDSDDGIRLASYGIKVISATSVKS
jgi:hypothetical protein